MGLVQINHEFTRKNYGDCSKEYISGALVLCLLIERSGSAAGRSLKVSSIIARPARWILVLDRMIN